MIGYSTNQHTPLVAEITRRLQESAPIRLQLLTGPRQVGKTTALLALQDAFAPQATYAAADAPESWLPGWWENLWRTAEDRAQTDGLHLLLLDEIQSFPEWSKHLKSQMDRVYRKKIPLQVVASGSLALEVGNGTRETMAGRFEKLRLLHWSAGQLATTFGLSERDAATQLVRQGAFPGAAKLADQPARWRDYVRQSIVEPAVGRDLLALEQVRRPALLRQLFAICAGHPSEILSLQKLVGQLQEKGSADTVAHYLHLLEEACLIASVPKFSEKSTRQRAAPPKLVALSNAFLGAFLPQDLPTAQSDPALWDRWVENACLAHAWNADQKVSYWRTEPLEVDGVLDGSWGKWALEIKTSPVAASDLAGILHFCRLHPTYRPLLLCEPKHANAAERAGVPWLDWREYLAKA